MAKKSEDPQKQDLGKKEKVDKSNKASKASKVDKKEKAPVAAADVHLTPGQPRLLKFYRQEVAPKLSEQFAYKNVMQVPRLEKIVLNVGLGKAVGNPNLVPATLDELARITGQKAVATRSKKAIANFKLRAGLPIGCMVTLRGERMWEFLDRFITVAMPRIRDFKGIKRKGDGHGNYTLPILDQTIFPEVVYENVQLVQGMNISFVTSARTDAECVALLQNFGMPFRS